MNRKKLLSILLAGGMTVSLVPSTVFADLKDEDLGWAKSSIERWNAYGVLNGDGNGVFHPKRSMTRGEFAAMLSNLMGYTTVGENVFADVPAGAWYSDAILKLNAAGILQGSAGRARPGDPISRQEAAVMLCRAMEIELANAENTEFADNQQIAPWAKDAVAALAERGMINGVGGNRFVPLQNIDKASVSKLLDNMVTHYITENGTVISGDVQGVVIVAAENVTFRDAVLHENLLIAPSASGSVKLENVRAEAGVIASAERVKLVADEKTQLQDVIVSAPQAEVQLAGQAGAVKVEDSAVGAVITVQKSAAVSKVETAAKNTELKLDGKVGEVTVEQSAADTKANLSKDTVIDQMHTSADNVKIEGSGNIGNLTVSGGSNVSVSKDTSVDQVDNKGDKPVDIGGQAVKPGEEVKPSKPAGNGGGSSGGGSSGPVEPEKPKWAQDESVTGTFYYVWQHDNVEGENTLTALVNKLTWMYPNAKSLKITLDASTGRPTIVNPELEYKSDTYYDIPHKPLELVFSQPSERNHTVTITGSTNQKITLQDTGAAESGYHQSELILNVPNAEVDCYLWMDKLDVQAVKSLTLHDNYGSLSVGAGQVHVNGPVSHTPIAVTAGSSEVSVHAPGADVTVASGRTGAVTVDRIKTLLSDSSCAITAKSGLNSAVLNASGTSLTLETGTIRNLIAAHSSTVSLGVNARIETASMTDSATLNGTGSVGVVDAQNALTLKTEVPVDQINTSHDLNVTTGGDKIGSVQVDTGSSSNNVKVTGISDSSKIANTGKGTVNGGAGNKKAPMPVVTVNQPTVADGKGGIANYDSTKMQCAKMDVVPADNEYNFSSENMASGLDAGTYWVRMKAAGGVAASDPVKVVIHAAISLTAGDRMTLAPAHGGTIAAKTTGYALVGETVTVTLTQRPDYTPKGITGVENISGSGYTYTFTMPSTTPTLAAAYTANSEIKTYTGLVDQLTDASLSKSEFNFTGTSYVPYNVAQPALTVPTGKTLTIANGASLDLCRSNDRDANGYPYANQIDKIKVDGTLVVNGSLVLEVGSGKATPDSGASSFDVLGNLSGDGTLTVNHGGSLTVQYLPVGSTLEQNYVYAGEGGIFVPSTGSSMDITKTAITLTGSWNRLIGVAGPGGLVDPQIIMNRTLTLANGAELTMDPGPDQEGLRLVLGTGSGLVLGEGSKLTVSSTGNAMACALIRDAAVDITLGKDSAITFNENGRYIDLNTNATLPSAGSGSMVFHKGSFPVLKANENVKNDSRLATTIAMTAERGAVDVLDGTLTVTGAETPNFAVQGEVRVREKLYGTKKPNASIAADSILTIVSDDQVYSSVTGTDETSRLVLNVDKISINNENTIIPGLYTFPGGIRTQNTNYFLLTLKGDYQADGIQKPHSATVSTVTGDPLKKFPVPAGYKLVSCTGTIDGKTINFLPDATTFEVWARYYTHSKDKPLTLNAGYKHSAATDWSSLKAQLDAGQETIFVEKGAQIVAHANDSVCFKGSPLVVFQDNSSLDMSAVSGTLFTTKDGGKLTLSFGNGFPNGNTTRAFLKLDNAAQLGSATAVFEIDSQLKDKNDNVILAGSDVTLDQNTTPVFTGSSGCDFSLTSTALKLDYGSFELKQDLTDSTLIPGIKLGDSVRLTVPNGKTLALSNALKLDMAPRSHMDVSGALTVADDSALIHSSRAEGEPGSTLNVKNGGSYANTAVNLYRIQVDIEKGGKYNKGTAITGTPMVGDDTSATIQLTADNSVLRLRDIDTDENRFTLIGVGTLNKDWIYGTTGFLDVGYNVPGRHILAGALTITGGKTLTIPTGSEMKVYGDITVASQTETTGIQGDGHLSFNTDGHITNHLTLHGISLTDIRTAGSIQKNWFNTPTTLNECVVTLDDGDYIDQLGGAKPKAIFSSKLDYIKLRGLKNLDFRLSQNTDLNGDFAFGTGDTLNLYQSWIIMGDETTLTFSGNAAVTLEDALGPMSDRFMLGTNAELIFEGDSTLTGFQKTQGTSTIMPLQAVDATGRLTVNQNVLDSLKEMKVVNFSKAGTYLYRYDPNILRYAWLDTASF